MRHSCIGRGVRTLRVLWGHSFRSALALLFPLAGCDRGTGEPVPVALVDTLANGAVLVSNFEAAGWPSGQPWTLVEELRLGVIDGGGPEQFSTISHIQVDDAGRIYVADGLTQEVRVFEDDGSHLRTMGGSGEGPEEFGAINGLDLDPAGNLWVIDSGNRRYSVFSPDGGLLETHALEVDRVIAGWRGVVDDAGSLIDWGYERLTPADPRDGTHTLYYPIRVGLGVNAPDTAPPLSYVRRVGVNGVGVIPFSPVLVTHHDRTGAIWSANEREYRIQRRTLSGDTTHVITLDSPPPSVSDAERDSILEAEEQWRPEVRLLESDIPTTKPVVRHILSDNERFLYVIPQIEGQPAGAVMDVFRMTGEYLGRIALPETVSIPYPYPRAVDDHIYFGIRDSLDIGYVTRWRIVREAGS